MILIGICGNKSSGKGSVAGYVAEWATRRGVLAVDRGFADNLKWAMARLFWPAMSLETAVEWANKFKNDPLAYVGAYESEGSRVITGRQLLQHGGTEMGREIFGDSFWIDQLLPLPPVVPNPPLRWHNNFVVEEDRLVDIATISDLRFLNEAKRIKQLGGQIWNVHRPGFEPDGHASEEPLDRGLIDVLINNNDDLDALRLNTFYVCDDMIGKGKMNK